MPVVEFCTTSIFTRIQLQHGARGDVVSEREVHDCTANRRFTFCRHKKTAGCKSIETEVKGVKVSIKNDIYESN